MLKKKLAATVLAAVLTVCMTTTALAHDGWSQTNAPIIGQGEVSYVDLLLGNHSNGHKSYRIAGQWSTDTSKVFVTTPADKKVDITATRFYTGEAATATEPAINNGFIASFSSSSPGAYIISVEGDSIFKHGETASRTLRRAKSFVAVSDIPILDRVKTLKGFSKAVNMDRAELVPDFNPSAVTPGEQLNVRLLLKGKPLANTEVSLIRRSNSEAQTLTTNSEGEAAFTTGPADYYLLRAKPSTDEKKDGEYSVTNYEATMTFMVQNGAVKLPSSKVNPVPYVYVNGKLVDAPSAAIKNGSTYVNASFVKQYLDASYTGEVSVQLRAVSEKLGANIEFLSAVGGTRSAVLIYTRA
ncbi:DUF4198 domain-containing protein [Paenibacillus sp. sgz302251]|uniref:DUF4198 domain-containing protein n=1 Tax=Paenibacillus sp. sgz302251 TaxID=3414493 RepID=UPI003C7EC0A2